ncbi:peptide synthetase [Colletotrichum karsti]|uniref:Peptide synthetase n=1 Tax=Colletotrichum karsti TaxID=1095194 RepID=A0A9P6IDD7_9PEZI|nr:peptide synthetase [Colletotrichum karsti]KAF9880550.1 peptide synthetase [Colletotrichum karsti]
MDDTESTTELRLSILNPDPERIPGPRLLHQLVHSTSDDSVPAIHSLDSQGRQSTWSYSQLHRAADALARKISAAVRGGRRSRDDEFVVPVLVPQCPQLYISMLAILKAGGAFCPLHLDAPPERVRFILQDVGAKVVVVTRDLVSKIPKDEEERTILIVDGDDDVEELPAPEEASEPAAIPQRLAYVMYTSGSTGTPKGVGVSHDAATQSLLAHNKHIPSFRRFLQFASPTFDVSVFEIFFPLFRGSTLVTCDRGRMLNDLPAIIRTLEVDACELTPTVAGSLLRSRKNAPCLRLLLTIGEMLTESVVNEFGGSEEAESILWGMYGPTEAAIHCTLRPQYPTDCPSSNIGFPLESVSCFVTGIPEEGSPYEFKILPLGEIGELVVGGHQLANGYLNRPEQTTAAFFDTPYGRVYRTGDTAKMNNDGTMECLGRISDGQVKLRGQRIELGEVEQAAMRTTGCHSAVAMVLGGILVMFCAIDDDSSSDAKVEEITDTCREWLPSFMVPGDVVLMKSFPRLPSGKVDRKQLKSDYDSNRQHQPTQAAEPIDSFEREIAGVVSDLLGFQVSPSTNLGSSGIDSLMTIRLASALREKGFAISATDVLESRNLSGLCSRLRPATSDPTKRTQENPTKYSDIPIGEILNSRPELASTQNDIEAVHWCTPLQNAMLAETSVNSQAYCNWIELEVPAGSTSEAVESWIREVAITNDIFRSGFLPFERGFAQLIFRQLPGSSIRHVAHLDRDFTLESDEDFLHPFRVQIQKEGSDRGVLVLLQLHHALYDGWSADMMLEDLSNLAAGKSLQPRPQFQDVASFFSDPSTKSLMDEARTFWAESLLGWQRHGLPRLMGRLPDRPAVHTATKKLNISRADLDESARYFQCHPQVFFQAALAWLWAGLQGQSDVAIGSVSSGRTIPVTNVERIMGPFISSTPLRVNLKGMTTIADLIRAVHSTNRQVLQHGILPLNEIKKLCGLSLGDSIFDVLFVYQESLYSQARNSSQVREVAHQDFLETCLLVEIEPLADGPSCRVTHHTNAISDEHAKLLVDQLESVVSYLLHQPKANLDTIGDCLAPELTSVFNANPSTLTTVPDLAAIFEQATDLAPNATAIRFANSLKDDAVESISYKNLNTSANQIARYLQQQGAKEGDIVGLIMEKSIPLYAAMLGILKAGCAYLPLLPTTPTERIRAILSQAEVSLCVADQQISAALTDLPSCHFVDTRSADTSTQPRDNVCIAPNGERPAYVIYTSGTTGQPKGVVVTQKNIAGNLDVLSRIYPITSNSRFLQACSQAFDVSVFEIFFTWKVGACLCPGTNDTLFEDLERAIRFLGCTHLSMTPTVASLVEPRNVPGVEFLVTAGEPMTAVVAKKWTGYLYQGYGPAETTNICTVRKMNPGDFIDHLGFSFENTSTIVLGPHSLSPLPVGFAGELCFGGDQVAAGYLGMPKLTNSKFIDHPQLGRIYRSGDMGRMLPDGSLMVLGRMDDQLKLRGQRIDTGEISSIITTSGLATSNAAVIVSRNNSPATQLAVFYVPANGSRADFEILPIDEKLGEANNTLIGLLRSRLPAYMVPTYLFPISSIPLTSSGKIDRAKLQSSFRDFSQEYLSLAAGSSGQREEESAWSEKEKTIAQALSQVLSVPLEEISRWQPFAAVGLDSISAISLARALQSSFQRRIPVSLILRCGSVARLAQEISSQTSTADSESVNPTNSLFPSKYVDAVKDEFARAGKPVSAVLPCTPLQEAMLSSTATSSYSNQLLFKLHIPESDMIKFWKEMCHRHGILRTCFITTRDSKRAVAQVVLESWSIPCRTFECSNLREAADQHANELTNPLDSKVPPVSLAFIKVDGQTYFSFVCHHAMYDGVAIDVLLSEVESLALGESLEPPVDHLPILLEILESRDVKDTFWKDHFNGFKSAQHKISSRLSEGVGHKETLVVTDLVDVSFSNLQSICKSTGVSMLSFFQTVWSAFLSLAYNETDVCFGNVVSGRALNVEGIDRLVAPCFNTLPVRIELPPSTSFATLLKKLQNLNPRLLERQFTPLRSVQSQVSKSGEQLFDSLLLLQQPQKERVSSVWELIEDNGSMDVPLVCEVIPNPHDDFVSVKLHSNGHNITQEILAGLLRVFLHLVADTAKHPAASVPSRENLPDDLRRALEDVVVAKTADDGDGQVDLDNDSVQDEEWSDAEKQIRSIMAELSETPISKIRRNTTIFQLGLDSINAVQLAAIMREQGLQLSALEVIEFPTCAKMASHLGTSVEEEIVEYDFSKFEREINRSSAGDGAEKLLPCTPLQCAMLNDFIQSGGKDYLNYMSFALDAGISLAQVQRAWNKLCSHHEILRTGFLPTEHRDASFAMIQHPAAGSTVPLTTHDNEADSFNVTKWKLDTAHSALQSLQNPPWAVALESRQTGVHMQIIMHHALYDAYSLQLMLRDLAASLANNAPQEHPPLNKALSKILQAATKNGDSEDFWKQKSSEVIVNRFPTLTPLSEESPELASMTKTTDTTLKRLTDQAKQIGVPIQVILEAAWTRVLSAYLGEEDVVFGVVLSGRIDDETKSAVFPCINTVPVVAHSRSSNSELLQQMLEYHNQLLKHQHAPLAQIQRWLGHSNSQVFDTLLVYQRMPDDNNEKFPWQTISDEGNLDYPVSLEVEPLSTGEIQLRVSHRTDVLPVPQARHMLDQFDAVLQHLAHSPSGKEDDLWTENASIFSITPPAEPNIASEEQFLHQFVETKAQSHPNKTALEFLTGFDGEDPISREWTFKELNEKGNQVANLLAPHSKVGHVIAIHFDKCPEACFSILGILKSGCAFLALDPSAPKARKEFILKDSGALALLTNTNIDFTVEQPVLHVEEALLDDVSKEFSTPQSLSIQDNSYCLYTSGTTGTPKGCEITHESAVQAMKAFQRLFEGHWDHNSKWLQFASFHFDVSVLEQYWSWSVGMTLVGAPRDLILDDLAGTIRRLEITHIDLTPSLARLLDPAEVPSLSRGVFITGGEALKQEILDVWGPVGVIYNAYGPTEATIGVTMYQRVPHNGRASNIGKQFDNVGSYVFRPGTNIPVMKGAVGELCVSGKLVGKGYLNRPELTQERFPHLDNFGERVYRTGDLVRLLHDGCFDFLGRADDQVKLRGQRLEIGEINHSIRTRVPEVSDVATLVTKHGSLDKDLLVSFVSCKSTAASKADLQVVNETNTASLVRSVQKACRDTLPGYMVPSYIFQVSRIPLSPNNKADVKQLNQLFKTLTPEKLVQLSPSSRSSAEPTNELQRQILSTMEEFLDNDTPVSLSSNIFDLGVDSISALRLSRLMRKNGLSGAAPRVILRNPELGDLAEALQQSDSAKEGNGVHEARQLIQAFGHRYRSLAVQELSLPGDGDIEYVAPCTPLQEGMLSRFMSDQDEGAYFTAFRLKLAPEISIDKLKTACESLVQCHAILRTSFIQTPAGFAQVALKSIQLSWRDLRDLDDAEVESQLASAMPNLIHKNSRCVSNPLELIMARLGKETILVVHIFHALYDGVTFETMLRWVSEEYSHKEHAIAPSFLETLAHGPLANYDFSRQFWVEHLSSCLFDTIPRLQTGDATTIITRTKTYSARNLETLRRSLNVTLQSVVLALWTSVFKKHFPINAGTGVIVSGRSIDMDQIENTIGPLFNTLLFYAGLKEGDTWLSLIQKCHEFNTAVLQFQHVPLRNIQKWCTKSKGRPIFENLFVFQVETAGPAEPSGMWSIMDDYSVSDYPLAFEASATPDGQLRVQIVAHGDVADEATMNSLFEEIDEAMVDVTSRATYSLPVSANHSREASTAASPRTPLTSRPESIDGDFKDQELLHTSDFEWTPAALVLRREIAALSGASEESITENMALLELGLDSIDLVKLSARLKHFGHHLTLSQLMKSRTIAAMSTILNQTRSCSEDSDSQSSYEELKAKLRKAVELTQFDLERAEAVLPPTPLQESMIADMLQSDFEQYFNHDVLELADGVDIDKFERAWQQVVEQSPILRTIFVQVEDPSVEQTFAQAILKSNPPKINKFSSGAVAEVQDVIDKHTQLARDAQGGSNLIQLSVIPVEAKSLLVLSISHALYDGWSLSLLHHDIAAAYRDQLTERPQIEPFLQGLVKTPTDQSKKFWSQYLANSQPSLLPQKQASSQSSKDATYRSEAVSTVGLERVTEFCKRHAISLQVLGQACWASTLATLLQSLEVSFGVVLAGRDSERAQTLMFPTMNTVAVRCVLHGSTTNFLRYLQETMGDIVEFQNYPLRKAQAIAGGRLFNTLFILQKNPESGPENVLMRSVQGSAATEFAVCAELEVTSKSLIWRIAGQQAYVSEKMTHQLLHQLDRALQYIIGTPDGNLLNFDGDNVSICQLPSFQARKTGPTGPSKTIAPGDEDTVWTETESVLRKVLSTAAGVDIQSVRKSHTLYNLGLDSISAIKVSALLRKEGFQLGVRALLTSNSIRDMAKQAQSISKGEHSQTTSPSSASYEMPNSIDRDVLLLKAGLNGSQVVEVLPPLPMQVYMMSAWQNSEGRVFYPDFFYRLHGSVSLEQLQSAWAAVVDSEPILRTCLIATGDRSLPFVQVVLQPTYDGPHRHVVDDEVVSSRKPSFETQRGQCWPQVQLIATRDDEDSWLLKLRVQHSLYDGFSLPAILQELLSRIENTRSAAKPALNAWKSFLAAHHTEDVKRRNRTFWTKYLEGVTPAKSSKPEEHATSLQRVSLLKCSAVTEVAKLQDACSRVGVGLPALFFAAVAKALQSSKVSSSSSSATSIVFGIYYANRSLAEDLEPTFPTLNLVPLKVQVENNSSIISVAKQVQQDLHLISSHSTVGLWEVRDWTGIDIDCFVNFLHLGDGNTDALQQGNVSFELVSNGDQIEGLSQKLDVASFSASCSSQWLSDNAVRDAFPDALDIEASVNEKGMDIGVFGSAAKVSPDSAGELISLLSRILVSD